MCTRAHAGLCARAHADGGRSDERRRRLTPNKKQKDGSPFLSKGVPARGLVKRPPRLRPLRAWPLQTSSATLGVETRRLATLPLELHFQVNSYLWKRLSHACACHACLTGLAKHAGARGGLEQKCALATPNLKRQEVA